MGLRLNMAKAVGAVSAWGLKHVFHRPAANFPGKVALYADPLLVADLRPRIREGSVVVVGTNGKTTVTNLVADALEAAGKAVACNRTGANLDSGVATALLQAGTVDWGVFECDELWLSRMAPQLRPDYVVLLNLFRDQLDRMGEIALIQESIVEALAATPATTLVYNADDPLCQAIADRLGNACVPFGMAEGRGQQATSTPDAATCQLCGTPLEYEWRQYGQLGKYACPRCGFSRAEPGFSASVIQARGSGIGVALHDGERAEHLDVPFAGAYMAYNLLAAYAACRLYRVPFPAFRQAARSFDPHNGRLQRYEIGGAHVLLNLAKNPTGLEQSIAVAIGQPGLVAIAIFINDREADGHDVSWLWDADLQPLAQHDDLLVFAGGMRRNDLQVRLKHAGLNAPLVEGAHDFLEKARAANPQAACHVIANYTALPSVKSELDRLARAQHGATDGRVCEEPDSERVGPDGAPRHAASPPNCAGAAGGTGESPHAAPAGAPQRPTRAQGSRRETGAAPKRLSPDQQLPEQRPPLKLKIVHLYPTLLNLYGDGGNVTVLANRVRWRGMAVEVARIEAGQDFDLSDADIVFLGGGPDREQRIASHELGLHADELRAYVEDDGVLLAICGGYQILGRSWLAGDETVRGLGIIDAETKRAQGNARNRLVGNIALESPLAASPVIGYENHAGRTYLGGACQPFGRVANRRAHGNNDDDKADGARYRNVVATYLHGPLLAKNPDVADWLIQQALNRQAAKQGTPPPTLSPLDDTKEQTANAFMRKRLGI